MFGDGIDGFRVAAVGGPTACEIAKRHRTAQFARLIDYAVLDELGSSRDWVGKAFAGIGDEMLDLSVDACFDVGETFAGSTVAGGTDASEIVLLRADVAALAIAPAILEGVGLEDHLREGIVPADMPSFAKLLVPASDFAIARINGRVAVVDEGHQAIRRNALWNPIGFAGSNGRCRNGSRRGHQQKRQSGDCGRRALVRDASGDCKVRSAHRHSPL